MFYQKSYEVGYSASRFKTIEDVEHTEKWIGALNVQLEWHKAIKSTSMYINDWFVSGIPCIFHTTKETLLVLSVLTLSDRCLFSIPRTYEHLSAHLPGNIQCTSAWTEIHAIGSITYAKATACIQISERVEFVYLANVCGRIYRLCYGTRME